MSNLEDLIEKIIFYKDENQQLCINKYSKNWILSVIEESDEIKLIEQKFKDYDARGVDIIDFVRIFLNIIQHDEKETLYMVMGLIDLFKEICESFGLTTHVKCADIINYIVDTFIYSNPSTNHIIPTRKLPEKKQFGNNETRIREIDINAPIVYGESFELTKRLVKCKLITDSVHHLNSSVKHACYASEIKKIFALDSLADNICIYNTGCILEKRIYPKTFQDKKDIMILNFAWSNKQRRLGSCLKDFSLVFWDANDNFQFEKSFSVANFASDYQSSIWYIEFLNLWVTTDKTNEIHAWDIGQECLIYTIKSNRIRSNVIDIVAIDVLKLVAVSSMDKSITIWDFTKQFIAIEINLTNGGVHSFVYSSTFQTLITAGYENMISLWNINPHYFDYTLVGRLVGHASMVTAVQVIERTPMVISADDIGHIKVWDIRNFSCLQTLEMGARTVVSKLMDMYEIGKIGFVGSRVNLIDFDEAYDIKNKLKAKDYHWPIRVEYNFVMNELIVCTRKEVRFIDASTGRVKKIYSGLLSNNENDITIFRLVQQNKKFIIGDQRGNMGLYLYATGELLKPMKSHTNEVTAMKIDYVNKLIISSGWDSTICIQKETKTAFEIKRKVTNAHYRKEISLMEASVYHNLFITATNNNLLYFWDYEYARLIASIDIEEGAEPTAIQFINGYAIVVISTNIGTVHFFHFKRRDTTHIEIRNIATLDVERKKHLESFPPTRGVHFVNKLLLDVAYDAEDAAKPEEAYLYVTLNKGVVMKYDIESIFEDPEIVLHLHANTRSNYNAERFANEDFEESVKNYKVYQFSLWNPSQGLPKGQGSGAGASPTHHAFNNTHLKFYHQAASITSQQNSPHSHHVAQSNASIDGFGGRGRSESKIKSTIQLKPINMSKENSKPSSPPDKSPQNKSEPGSMINEGLEFFQDLSTCVKLSFQAHKDAITTLAFMLCPEKKLLTSSLDYYFKIWDLDGSLLASVNVNHPLPIKWDLETNTINKAKKRVLYGMKIIETIFKRYERKIILTEEKKININRFLAQLDEKDSSNSNNMYADLTSSTERRNQKLVLMKDEFEPRDIQYHKVKEMYQHELQGPSLRQMESTKRLMVAQKMWKEQKSDKKPQIAENNRGKEESEQYNNELMSYLLSDQRLTLGSLVGSNLAHQTKLLAKRLDFQSSGNKKKMQPATLNGDKDDGGVQTSRRGSKKGFKQLLMVETGKKPKYFPFDRLANDDARSEVSSPAPRGPQKSHITEAYHQQAPNSAIKGALSPRISSNLHQSQSTKSLRRLNSPNKKDDIIAPLSTRRGDPSEEHERKRKHSKFVSDLDHSPIKSGARSPLQQSSILSKKRSLPSLDFYNYANQKNLLSPDARSVKSQISTDVSTSYGTGQKDRRIDFQQIISSLDRRLRKSQLLDSNITFKTITDCKKNSDVNGDNTDTQSEAKTVTFKGSQSQLSRMKTESQIPNGLPKINFNENLESFRKNMDKMVGEIMKGPEEDMSTRIARQIEERLRISAAATGEEFEGPNSDGKKQDFVGLGQIFQKVGDLAPQSTTHLIKKEKRVNIGSSGEFLGSGSLVARHTRRGSAAMLESRNTLTDLKLEEERPNNPVGTLERALSGKNLSKNL